MNKIPRSIKPSSTVRFFGVGNSGNPFTWGDANRNGLGFWFKSNATSGDTRALYVRQYFGGAGSGEALRAYATCQAASVATGGTVNGAHISLSLDASASVSGQGFAARFTLGAAADTRTLNGNLGVINVETDIATGNTVPATVALIHFKEIGAVAAKKAFRFPTVASAGMLAAHTTDAMTHSVRCVDDAGTVVYLMATTTATNRTGGA